MRTDEGSVLLSFFSILVGDDPSVVDLADLIVLVVWIWRFCRGR